MPDLNSLDALLEYARSATPETVGQAQAALSPAIVELALTKAETDQVHAALKEATGTTLSSLRDDFSTYQRANGLTAERDSVGTALVRLVLGSGTEMWHDLEGNPGASLRINGHLEHHSLRTKAFKRYLAHLHYQEHKSAPHAQGVQDALATLEAKAVFEGPEYPIYTRLAEVGNVIYLDLGNDRWQVVRITAEGWEVIEADAAPVRFRRPRGMLPIPTPQRGGTLAELAKLLNVSVTSRDWKLIVAWLVQALRGKGPYPLLVLLGGQGSGKSTAAKLLRALLDPNVSPLRSLSRDERDLFIAARNGWALAFDNISGLTSWISDAFCKLSTGGGLLVRELFSDDDETLLDAMRPVVLNGISDFVERQDLVDRALQVHLPAIAKTERRPERELWARFDDAQPRILGALLDVVAAGLHRLPTTTLDGLPRLADFALWATACEAPLGWQPGEFVAAYAEAQDDLIKDALEAEPVAVALLTLLTPDKPEWTGTASELLKDLTDHKYGEGRTPKGWPGAAHVLAGVLKRVAPALLVQGLEVAQLNRGGKSGSKTWHVRYIGDSERQKRQNVLENAEKHVQHDTSLADAPSDAPSLSDAPSVRSPEQASVDNVREGQHNSLTDASDAPCAPSSKWAGLDL